MSRKVLDRVLAERKRVFNEHWRAAREVGRCSVSSAVVGGRVPKTLIGSFVFSFSESANVAKFVRSARRVNTSLKVEVHSFKAAGRRHVAIDYFK